MDYDPYMARRGKHVHEHVHADTPVTMGAHSHHAGHSTPSGASVSDAGSFGFHAPKLPSTPSAAMRETDGDSSSIMTSSVGASRTQGRGDASSAASSRAYDRPDYEGVGMIKMIESQSVVRLKLRLKVPFEKAGPDGSKERRRFRRQFIKDISSETGIDPRRIAVVQVEPGSILVTFDVYPEGQFAPRDDDDSSDEEGSDVRGSSSYAPKTPAQVAKEMDRKVRDDPTKMDGDLLPHADRKFGVHSEVRPSAASGQRTGMVTSGPKSETASSYTASSYTASSYTASSAQAPPPAKKKDDRQRKINPPPLPGIVQSGKALGAARKAFHNANAIQGNDDGLSVDGVANSGTAALKAHAGVPASAWTPEVLNLDYSPVTAAVPSGMRVPLRQRRAGRVVRLVIGVTCYNEDGDELRLTMQGIVKNLGPLLRTHRIASEEVLVAVLIDGMDKASDTMLAYCRRLGLYDDDLVIDEVEVPSMKTHRRKEQKPRMMAVDADGYTVEEYDPEDSDDEDNQPTTRQVTMHIFERSVPLPKDETGKSAYPPLPMVMALKAKNGGKLSSHLWLFEGVCRQLHPQYVMLLDVGTAPYEKSISRLVGLMERSPNVGGCCGQIVPRKPRWYHPLEGAQAFEYKTAHQLLKSAEAAIGFITVLPGAFSMYRWEAIRGVPIERYFLLEATPPGDIDPVTANMFLAEDRILCFEIVAQVESQWILGFDPGAFAETDVPQSLNEFVRQRRRWANGAFGAMLWALSSTGRMLRAQHSLIRKLFFLLQAGYNAIILVVNWFQPAAFFLAFLVILGNALDRREISVDLKNGLQFVATLIYMLLFVVQLVLSLAGDISHLKSTYETIAFIWAAVMFGTIVMAATVAFSVDVEDAIIVITLVAAFGIYLLGSIAHVEVPQTFIWSPHYILMLPSMANMVATYSISNLNSTTWGTKGAHSNALIVMNRRQEAALAREDARRLGHAIRDLAQTTKEHLMRRHGAHVPDPYGTSAYSSSGYSSSAYTASNAGGGSMAGRSQLAGSYLEAVEEEESSGTEDNVGDAKESDEPDENGVEGGPIGGGPVGAVPRPGRTPVASRLYERAPNLTVDVRRNSGSTTTGTVVTLKGPGQVTGYTDAGGSRRNSGLTARTDSASSLNSVEDKPVKKGSSDERNVGGSVATAPPDESSDEEDEEDKARVVVASQYLAEVDSILESGVGSDKARRDRRRSRPKGGKTMGLTQGPPRRVAPRAARRSVVVDFAGRRVGGKDRRDSHKPVEQNFGGLMTVGDGRRRSLGTGPIFIPGSSAASSAAHSGVSSSAAPSEPADEEGDEDVFSEGGFPPSSEIMSSSSASAAVLRHAPRPPPASSAGGYTSATSFTSISEAFTGTSVAAEFDPTATHYREDLEAYLAAIRRAEQVRMARLAAAEEAERQAKARDFDPKMLAVRFNNFRLRTVLLWFLSNAYFILIVYYVNGIPTFAFGIAAAIVFTGGLPALGSFYFQFGRLFRTMFRYCCFPSCYVRDDRFEPAKYRCCCRREKFYDDDVEWAENARYVRPINKGSGLLREGEFEYEGSEFGDDKTVYSLAEPRSDYYYSDTATSAYATSTAQHSAAAKQPHQHHRHHHHDESLASSENDDASSFFSYIPENYGYTPHARRR